MSNGQLNWSRDGNINPSRKLSTDNPMAYLKEGVLAVGSGKHRLGKCTPVLFNYVCHL